jgi:hypothetical protein
MVRTLGVLGVAMIFAAATLTARAADPPKSAEAGEQEARAQGAELLSQAYRLAEIGEKQQLPEAYVLAGSSMLMLNALTKGKLDPISEKPEVLDENDKPVAGAKVKTETVSLESIADGYFESASSLGLKQKRSAEIEALVKAAKACKYDAGKRGSVGGPQTISRSLAPHETHHYTFRFWNGATAAVGFNSSFTTRFKLAVSGNPLYAETGQFGNYTWVPRGNAASKEFDVTVHNPHDRPITYRLFKN